LVIEESIRIRPAVLAAIEDHARAAAPAECCGLLIAGEGCIDEVLAVYNQAADPARHYEVSPRDYLDALKRCRGTDRIVIGAYHSHPGSLPEPSPTDRAAAFSDFLYLIAGPVTGPADLAVRAYRLKDGNFHPVRLVLDPREPQT
jgi:proteasome lid subunit RPN8/RPN11